LAASGKIVSRVLRMCGIPFTALEVSYQQVDFVRRFGSKIYFGDATRLDLLMSAKAGNAKLFVLAIDDVEASLKTAALVRQHFPDLPILARARNRTHFFQLRDLGIKMIYREHLSDQHRSRAAGVAQPWIHCRRSRARRRPVQTA